MTGRRLNRSNHHLDASLGWHRPFSLRSSHGEDVLPLICSRDLTKEVMSLVQGQDREEYTSLQFAEKGNDKCVR